MILLSPQSWPEPYCVFKEAGVYTTADDFKQIHGIGPAIEKRLHQVGILTFSQLSAMSPEELATLFTDMTGFSVERIIQKNWIGQARRIVAEQESVETADKTEALEGRQHYAVFTVELLLDEENIVRRTRAMHVQSQAEEVWASWEEPRLVNFFVESAGLKIPQPQEAVGAKLPPAEMVEVGPGTRGEPQAVTPTPAISGELRLGELVLRAAGAEERQRPIYSDQTFRVKFMLDLADVKVSRDVPLDYSAKVYAKRLGEVSRLLVGQAEGRLLTADRIDLDVEGVQLPRGTYRMEAFVKLSLPGEMAKPGSGLMAMTEGGLLQIY